MLSAVVIALYRMREYRVVKRSISIAEHKTSVSLEDSFWDSLRHIAVVKRMSLRELVASIDTQRQGNLSSAIRLFVLSHYQELANPKAPAPPAEASTSDDRLVQQAYGEAMTVQADQPPLIP